MSGTQERSTIDAADRSELLQLATGFYRDEMRRTVAWRDRLDRTSNWAVVLSASILTFAFSSPENPHYVLLAAIAAVLVFLLIEARRYRQYDIWRSRIRLLEECFFGPLLASGSCERGEWTELLAADLKSPRYRISFGEACRHRLRRVYLALLLMIGLSWVARITAFEPGPFRMSRDAAIGDVPGTGVAVAVAVLYLAAAVVSVFPVSGNEYREAREDGRADDEWGDEPE